MKRKIILSIALVISIALLSLIKSDSTINAQQPERFTFDTGVIKVGANQLLRVNVAAGDINGDTLTLRYRRLEYMQTGCGGGMCTQSVSSNTASALITLAPNESIVFDDGSGSFKRGIVTTSSRNVRVNAQLIDAATGETQVLIALLVP